VSFVFVFLTIDYTKISIYSLQNILECI